MTPQQIDAMKLALDLATMHHTDDGYAELRAKVRSASKEALEEHAMREVQRLGQEIEQEPCDMGEMCLGCSPRSADGSCPDAKPSGACDCYKDGFRDGMNEFKECYEEQPAQPEQEPVAWVKEDVCDGQYIDGRPRKIWWECNKGVGTAFYTAPPQRTWVELTDEQIEDCYKQGGIGRAIQLFKEKNT